MSIKDVLKIKKGDWEAVACPRLGGNVISLTYKGKDVFVPLVDESQLDVNPYLQGSPLLFPANRTTDGKFTFEGKDYTLPLNEDWCHCHLHGFVHMRAFDVVEHKEDEITMKYTYATPDEWFPFPCEISVTYSIDGEGFKQSYRITNIGKGNLPAVFCMHSTFVEPETFSLPIYLRQEAETCRATGRYIPLTAQERAYKSGSPSKGLDVDGYYLSCGHTATIGDFSYTTSEKFDHWVLYNGLGKSGYICIEPQCGRVNGLNVPDGHVLLAPGESLDLWAKLTCNK